MSPTADRNKPARKPETANDDADEEPDPWDVRINNTGCATENEKLSDCWNETKDWRMCAKEMLEFRNCWKQHKNDKRTEMKDA